MKSILKLLGLGALGMTGALSSAFTGGGGAAAGAAVSLMFIVLHGLQGFVGKIQGLGDAQPHLAPAVQAVQAEPPPKQAEIRPPPPPAPPAPPEPGQAWRT